MDRLLQLHNHHIQDGVAGEVQAAWLHHRFTQIHPFQDGNGRVARALALLVLLKNGLFPLIITRDDRANYIKALEEADNGNLQSLINIFVKSQRMQFRKASKTGEITYRSIPSTDSALTILQASANAYNDKSKRKLLSHSSEIETELKSQLNKLVPKIKDILEQIHSPTTVYRGFCKTSAFQQKYCPGAPLVHFLELAGRFCKWLYIQESDEKTDHYYRYQIINNAKLWEYYANTDIYRYWVDLRMYWTRRARLVFSIHGIGKPTNLEALVCSPFLDLKDIVKDDEEAMTLLIPVAEDGFIFFKNEESEQIRKRFLMWLDQVLSTFLIELSRNL